MIDEKVATALEEFRKMAAHDDRLKQLSEFYAEMKRQGVAQNQGYTLPPVDTVGSTAYRQRR